MKAEKLAAKHIVLLGIGHTNAHIVRKWAMAPLEGVDLTCISNHEKATYSGMLPAALAGQISRDDMEIDLVQLCESVGARLIIDEVESVDPEQSIVQFKDRPSIPFDVLSVGIGSVPTFEGVDCEHGAAIQIKPMQTFLDRLAEELLPLKSKPKARGVVVGSGIAGIEILLCLGRFLHDSGIAQHELDLVTRSSEILPSLNQTTRLKAKREIERRGYGMHTSAEVVKVHENPNEPGRSITLASGQRIDCDFVIWATGATSPPKLQSLGLPTDTAGFLPTDSYLLVNSTKNIFAVGDTGSIAGTSIPKAGVYAVRQGPILWDNIARCLRGQPLRKFHPQKKFLKLINFGDGRALAEWHGFSAVGRAAYRLKHRIDSEFMEKYRPRPMTSDEPMQCRGCGCKLGAEQLESAIEFDDPEAPKLEDASPIGGDASEGLYASTDFFTLPFRDAYLNGRVAALHSASDLIASGTRVTEALANVVLPEGDSKTQRKLLADFNAGANLEFQKLGARIVGGHTIVGPRFEAGFTVIGKSIGTSALTKDQLTPGDQLYVTKPIGIGVLLAAHMRSACRANDYKVLLDTILEDQSAYSQVAVDSGVTSCTDVTGFGLAGHLLEMLMASGVSARIELETIPLLPGVKKAIEENIQSSLLPDNMKSSRRIDAAQHIKESADYQALFDPQTSGGLLFGIAKTVEESFLASCTAASLELPHWIGEVVAQEVKSQPLSVV